MTKMNFTLLLLSCLLSVNLFGQNVPSYVPTNGLVGWWPFNGNANDESGNGNNGTVNGATLTSDRFGVAGRAYDFDGISDFIDINLNTSLNPSNNGGFTLSGWINSISYSHTLPQVIVSLFDSQGNLGYGINYGNSDGNNGFLNGQGGTSGVGASMVVSQSIPPIINTWYNVILTCDFQTNISKLYINGLFETQSNSSLLSSNFTNVFIGKWNTSNWYANGKLDDIGIWNRALSQQEVSALYNGNLCYQTITVTDTLLINTNITSYNPVTYENTIKIWPNPAKTHITIDAGDLNVMNGYSLRIVNAFGQQVFQSAINQQQFYLDLSTWTGAGIYYVNIVNPQGATIDIKKIVIQ